VSIDKLEPVKEDASTYHNFQLIHTLTGDKNIVIGHGHESQTNEVEKSTYFNHSNNSSVTLVDTPGFDDSRDGVTDTDVLRKIACFLQDK